MGGKCHFAAHLRADCPLRRPVLRKLREIRTINAAPALAHGLEHLRTRLR